MRISDIVAQHIRQMLDDANGNIEIQRNELALEIGCVPSQINYVITSRFTPEQGYIVKSRRGGGGYIRITRVHSDKGLVIMHVVNSIGSEISPAEVSAMLSNLKAQNFLSREVVEIMESALSDKSYTSIPPMFRDVLRASLFKNMLLTQI